MRLRTQPSHWQGTILFSITLVMAGCSSTPPSSPSTTDARPARASAPKSASSSIPVLPPAGSGRGAYYLDDGPGENPPQGLLDMPDAEPRVEPYSRYGNRSYVVFGKRYTPFTDERPFKQRGIGSWYGKKFHGQKTSSGEIYDMYKMTAAHPTLPIPSYARVTNLANGKQVIVRVNDRGPFHSGRVIDLSYTAALKLGYLDKGSSKLEVERLLPDEIVRMAREKREQATRVEQAMTVPAADAAMVSTEPVGAPSSQPGPLTAKPEVVAANASVAPALAPGFYIQLGAYAQAGNAEAVRARLMQNWASVLPPIEVVEHGMHYRLHSGPFGTRAEAAAAAQQLQHAGTSKPHIVQR